jgi:hypothetical protein
MMLQRLELQAFGRFRDEVVEFAPGMNLVSGPNDSGKTTLVQAVTAVLFGAGQAARFVPWEHPDSCSAALVWTSNDRQVRIERDFVSGQVTCSETDESGDFKQVFRGFPESEAPDAEGTAYLSYLQSLLGVSRRDLFQALLYGDPMEGAGGTSPEHLKACLCDGEAVLFNEMLKTLQDEYLAISSANSWGEKTEETSALEHVALRLGELEKEWFSVQEAIRHRERPNAGALVGTAFGDEEATVGHVTSGQVSELSPEEEKAQKYHPVDDAPEASAKNPVTRRTELEAELAKTGLPKKIPAQLPELLIGCGELRQTLAEHKRALGARQEERRRCHFPAWQKPLGGLAAVWGAAWIWAHTQSSFAPVWGGLLLSATVGAWYVWGCLQARSSGLGLDKQIAGLEEQIGGLQEQLTDMKDRFEAIGLSPSPVEMVRMQKNLPRHLQILDELEKIEQEYPGNIRNTACTSPIAPETVTASVGQPAVGDSEIRAEETMPVDDGGNGGNEIPVESSSSPVSSGLEELLAARCRIEAEGEVLRVRESCLKARAEILISACSLIRETLDDRSRSDCGQETFIRLLGQVLNDLTGGGIEQVRLTESFNVELPGPDGAWLPVERFSSGVRTLVRMALCLALNRLRCEPARLPMLLDDPLGSFDRKRRGLVMKVLEECAAGQQVILFSHEEALRRRAAREGWHLVSLRTAGPSVAANNEEKNHDDGQLSFL